MMQAKRRFVCLCLSALLCAASAVGCGRETAETSSTDSESIDAMGNVMTSEYDAEIKTAGTIYTKDSFAVTVSYVSWTETANQLFIGALNHEKMAISSVHHLPIYKLDTTEDLTQFKQLFDGALALDSGYDEVPSFNSVTASCDADFFEENALMLVYIMAPSGSFRFDMREVYCDGNAFCIYAETTNDPVNGTADMAGWFITVAVPHDIVKDCTVFDAVLD